MTEDDEDEVVEQDPTGAQTNGLAARLFCTASTASQAVSRSSASQHCVSSSHVRSCMCILAGRKGPAKRRLPSAQLAACPARRAGRYSRYKQQVGSGRFKVVFKGFDEKQGIDVAWSKIEADPNGLSHDQMKRIVDEISYGLGLDHPHVIKVRRGAAAPRDRAGQGRGSDQGVAGEDGDAGHS